MSLSTYIQMDFSKKSDAAKDLLSRLEHEVMSSDIVLTPVYSSDETPPFLTQEMGAWYAEYIQTSRVGAVDEVSNGFTSRGGKLFEQERDRIEHEKFQAISGERDILRQNKDVDFLFERVNELRSRYDEMKLRLGREAKEWTPVLYWIVLLAFMLPELLINWDSFLKIPGFTPAYATGLIVVVAIAFAFSAHSLGRIVKQWKELFGGHVELTERRKTTRELVVGLLLFALGITAVAWGRWFFIQGALLEKVILHGGGLEFSDWLNFGGAMLGNFMVYLLGFLWSLVKHDSVPEFSETRHELSQFQQRLIAAFDKHLTKRNQQHFQKAARRQQEAVRGEEAQRNKLDNYSRMREAFISLRDKDAQVIALLREYKTRLLSQIRASKNQCWFHIDDVRVAEMETTIRMSPDQYAAITIELRYA